MTHSNYTLETIRGNLDRCDWEDSDLTPVSFIGSIGNARKLIAIIDAADEIYRLSERTASEWLAYKEARAALGG